MMKSITMRYLLLSSGVISLFLFSPGAVLAGEKNVSMLASTCFGCHGIKGATQGPATPSIAGLTDEYLNLSMQDYKSDKRKSTVMNRIAKGYTDDEIKKISKYFSSQTFVSVKQSADTSLVAKGKELQKQYCDSCHEKDGALADGIGVLAGQPIPYLKYTIDDFQSGDREMERRKKQKMDQLVKDAGVDGFNAIIQYYGSR